MSEAGSSGGDLGGAGGADEIDDATLRRRRAGEVTGTASESWVGSTMIARRESRRRSARLAADEQSATEALEAPVDDGREALEPGSDAGSYRARPAGSILVPRRARPRPRALAPDPVVVPIAPVARRLAARRLLVAAGGAVALVVVGAILLVVLIATI